MSSNSCSTEKVLMKKILALLLLPAVAGCLTASQPEIALWKLDFVPEAKAKSELRYGVTRILQVAVRAPYESRSLGVLRKDGSMAFDGYNEFAALPSHLLKGVVYDALKWSGKFAAVISPSSSVRSEYSLEIVFERLVLDCRGETRQASVLLEMRLVNGADRTIAALVTGEGVADATAGDYSAAFSAAVSRALEAAMAKID